MNREQYLLICLSEELAEMQHAISKILRFTRNDKHVSLSKSNAEQLDDEWADVNAVISLLQDNGFYIQKSLEREMSKKLKLRSYMEYSRNLGVLNDDSDN
jgi:hypothetical protein